MQLVIHVATGANLDTRILEAFKAVYETGSIARAANSQFISAQGLSKAIKRLEAELGHELFVRTARGVEPTGAAHVLYSRVAELSAMLDSIRQDMAAASRTVLNVAVSSGYFVRFGSGFMRGFETRVPGCSLQVAEHLDEEVLVEVETGRADCGFTSARPSRATFDSACLTRHPYVLLAAPEHPLVQTGRATLHYADLEGLDLVALGSGHSPYRTIKARLDEAGVRPASFIPIVEITTGIDLARRGEACCFITDFAASSFAGEGIAALGFSDTELTWDFSYVRRKGAGALPAADALRDLTAVWLAEHRGELFG